MKSDKVGYLLESQNGFRHGAPAVIPADDEFHNGSITKILDNYLIVLKPSSTRRFNKTRIVERKVQTHKIITRRIHLQNEKICPFSVYILCSISIRFLFLGNKIMT